MVVESTLGHCGRGFFILVKQNLITMNIKLRKI